MKKFKKIAADVFALLCILAMGYMILFLGHVLHPYI